MKLLWAKLKKYKNILAGALALAVINQFFSLLDPQIFRLIIDRYASKFTEIDQSVFVKGVIVLLLASVGVALISRIAKNFQDYFVHVITQRLGAGLYEQSVQHSFSLPFSVFEDQRSGELLQKLEKARSDSQTLVQNLINIVFLSLVGIAFVIVYAFFVHWSVGLVYFCMIPLLGGTTYFLSRRIKKAQENIVKESASLAGSTTETLRNVELVKSLGLETQEIERLNNVNQRILGLELKKIILVRKFSFTQGTIINALRSFLLLLMLWLVFQQVITLGEFFSLYIYSFFIFTPLSELGTVATSYQEAKASLEQLEIILRIKPESKPKHPEHLSALQSIEVKNLSFSYQSSNRMALADASFTIRSGETIAFVGPSGSGKTTIMKLLAGLYMPAKGSMSYNGVAHTRLDYDELRKRIGLVAQETQLFAGTIKENLRFVNPKASDEECRSALQAAAATSILERADQGLDTIIGEGGMKLSGGERQRLAIARALLRKPDLLLFDEATSSLDSITEHAITETIKRIINADRKLMTVLIAHRLSTILHADRIYVLEKGSIVESGTHQELLKRQGLYHALWREQNTEKQRTPQEAVVSLA